MYNYLMLVGTITKDIELKELANNKKVATLDLAVMRGFRNANGEYDCDFLKVTLWDFLADLAVDTLKKGSKVGIKGRIYPHVEQLASGAFVPMNELIGERLFFFDKSMASDELVDVEEQYINQDTS